MTSVPSPKHVSHDPEARDYPQISQMAQISTKLSGVFICGNLRNLRIPPVFRLLRLQKTGVLGFCLLATAAWAQAPLPPLLRNVGIDQRLNEQVPLEATFQNERGEVVRLGDYLGARPAILTLVYYDCPMLCTLVLNGLVKSLRTLSFNVGEQFDVVTVSFDPRETPPLAAAKKEAYLRRYAHPGAEKGWHFLTGKEESIRQLTAAVGFRYALDPETRQYAHASGIMVLTPEGKMARYFYGIEYAPRDLRLGLVEASHRQIGSPVDQVLLFCFHYDPIQGKYGLVIMNAIRAAGLATVLALGSFVVIMLRRERRGHAP